MRGRPVLAVPTLPGTSCASHRASQTSRGVGHRPPGPPGPVRPPSEVEREVAGQGRGIRRPELVPPSTSRTAQPHRAVECGTSGSVRLRAAAPRAEPTVARGEKHFDISDIRPRISSPRAELLGRVAVRRPTFGGRSGFAAPGRLRRCRLCVGLRVGGRWQAGPLMTDDVLQRFSPATRHGSRVVQAPTPAQEGAWQAIAPDTTPWSSRPPVRARPWPPSSGRSTGWPSERRPPAAAALSRALRLAAQGARRRRRAQPARAAGRHPPRRRHGWAHRRPDSRWRPLGRHPRGRATGVQPDPAGHPDHHAGVALPDAHLRSARETLRGVETVIVDEVHAVAGTKRGAHLALSLERLDALLTGRPSGSGSPRPSDRSTRWRGSSRGGRPVTSCSRRPPRSVDLAGRRPVADMTALGEAAPSDRQRSRRRRRSARASIWPHVEERIVDLVAAHRSTLVFANSRRLAERLTARLNEIWVERLAAAAEAAAATRTSRRPATGAGSTRPGRPADGAVRRRHAGEDGAAGASGAPAMLARAHHGSVSKEQRAQIEDALKAGRLPRWSRPAASSSASTWARSTSSSRWSRRRGSRSGLQRVGRAGHRWVRCRGACCSRSSAATWSRPPSSWSGCAPARSRRARPREPARRAGPAGRRHVAMDDWAVDALEALVRRSAPFSGLPRGVGVGARHAGRPLPQRRVRRAAPEDRVGSRHRVLTAAGARSGSP